MVPVVPVMLAAPFPPTKVAAAAAATAILTIAPELKPPPVADAVAPVAPALPAVITTELSC